MADIAVALQTCDRALYTQKTVESFRAHNPDLSRFVLLHGDDASSDPSVLSIAQSAGFRTVSQMYQREGWLPTRIALLAHACFLAPWVLLLEDDCETVRPFPWALFDFVSASPKVDTLRLYGDYKNVDGLDKCLTFDKRRRVPGATMAPPDVRWKPIKGAPEPSEGAYIHWSPQPAVTRSDVLWRLHTGGQMLGRTARVIQNVTSHIGVERQRTVAA
jgi:hypothetical protein